MYPQEKKKKKKKGDQLNVPIKSEPAYKGIIHFLFQKKPNKCTNFNKSSILPPYVWVGGIEEMT